jgi:hypothetical protein
MRDKRDRLASRQLLRGVRWQGRGYRCGLISPVSPTAAWATNATAPVDAPTRRHRPSQHHGERASGDVQFVPMLTSFARRAGMLRQASAGPGYPRAVRDRAAAPGLLSSRALGLRPLRAFRSRRGLLVSERASHEVPGFGAPAPPSA